MTNQRSEHAAPDTATIHPFKMACELCRVRDICLQQAVGEFEVEEFDSIVRRKELLQQHQHLVREGDKFRSLFAVRTGAIMAYKSCHKSEDQVIGFYYPGQIFGLDGIFSGRHSTSAIALETTAVCEIPYAELEAICATTPCLQQHLRSLLSQIILEDQQLITLLSKYSAEQRVATFLLKLIDVNIRLKLSPTHMRLPMRRIDIANYLGMTLETTSRVFSRLEKLNILQVNAREVAILDAEGLKSVSAVADAVNESRLVREV